MTSSTRKPSGEPIVEVDGLVTRFGSTVIHDHLSFTVDRGEIMGVVGGSGSGKSVMLRTILGLIHPAKGRIRLLGEEITGSDDAARSRRQRSIARPSCPAHHHAATSRATRHRAAARRHASSRRLAVLRRVCSCWWAAAPCPRARHASAAIAWVRQLRTAAASVAMARRPKKATTRVPRLRDHERQRLKAPGVRFRQWLSIPSRDPSLGSLQSRAYGEHDAQYAKSTRATVLVRSDGLRHSRLRTMGAWYGAWYGDW